MSTYASNNVKKLEEAGVIESSLHPHYQEFFDELSPDEMEVILDVKQRLDKVKADRSTPQDYAGFVAF
ncbi:MAG: aroma-sacti cluster domain-containing protein [Gaiellaceae bacterium]